MKVQGAGDHRVAPLPFVDTHMHLWDLDHPDLYYSWLMPDGEDPQLGARLEELKGTKYVVDDYIAETRSSNVIRAVHVQAALGIRDPVRETEWQQAAADRTGFPQAIVAYSNLKDPRVEEELARHCQYANMRGIRDFSHGDYLVDPAFHRGYALLEKYSLVAGVDVRWPEMAKARDLAGKFPNIPMVVDHAGEPDQRTDEYYEIWLRGMKTLAQADNVVCKISGLGMADNSWTVGSIRRWVLTCVETFGPERCVFGTNWPVDKLYSTYEAVIDAYTEIVADFSQSERVAMFSGNARELYGI